MLKKVSHIALVILLFVSTTGMTVDLHYCNHILYDIGIFSQAENCCMPHENEHKTTKDQHCDMDSPQKGDCEDQIIEVGHVDDFVATSFMPDLNKIFVKNLHLSIPIDADLYSLSIRYVNDIPEWNNPPPKLQVVLSLLQKYLL